MTEYITLAAQWFTIAMLIGIVWMNWRTRKNVDRVTELIGQYRREIEWLGARIEMLEQSRQSQKVTSSK